MLFPAALVTQAAAALRRALPDGVAPLLLSRFGVEFLGAAATQARPIEVALDGGCGRLLARRIALAGGDLLAISAEPARPGALPPALLDALPLLVGAAAGARAAITLQAAQALGSLRPPAVVRIDDWIRLGADDPLRWLDPALAGPLFVELRRAPATASVADPLCAVLERHAAARSIVLLARRGPSGATRADLLAAQRLGADAVAEGDGAELVAARHQGVPLLSLALLLDAADEPLATPLLLAERAARLLPGVAALLAELVASGALLAAGDGP